jgi:hypothetical protein
VLDGSVVLDPAGLRGQSDDEVVARLSGVRGIGTWTAQMFLIFQLRRLDVWPTGDLGVRKGFGLAWGMPPPTPKQLEALGDPYRPYNPVPVHANSVLRKRPRVNTDWRDLPLTPTLTLCARLSAERYRSGRIGATRRLAARAPA